MSCMMMRGAGQTTSSDEHINVVMRMIGDSLLANADDHHSRVLPIKQEGNRFIVSFESSLQFKPNELVNTIRGIIEDAAVSDHYIVEVIQVETKEVIYSFEINSNTQTDLIPCSGREQPRDDYAMKMTLLDIPKQTSKSAGIPDASNGLLSPLTITLMFGVVLLAAVVYRLKRSRESSSSAGVICIGDYQLDKRTMMLTLEGKSVELSSREVDLLYLLYSQKNEAIEREYLLKIVWGDEGHYIGRTLDVFVSKLRKRLSADENIRIINVRGYGYKLVC